MRNSKLKKAIIQNAKWATALFLLFGVSFFFLLYSSNTFLDYFITQTNNRFEVPKSTERIAVRNFLLNLYPTSFFSNETEKYPTLSLKFNNKTAEVLKSQTKRAEEKGYSIGKDKEYVRAIFLKDSIGIKLHGTTQGNFIGKKKSWSVKTQYENFNLINPKQHNYLVPFFANYFADKLELYHNNSELVNLVFNDNKIGLYWKEEKVNKDFLKNRELKKSVIVALNNNWLSATNTGEWGKVCQPNNIKRNKKKIMKQAIDDYSKLIIAIESEKSDSTLQYFEVDYLARFEAYRNLLGVCHDIIGDNLRMYYNNKTQQFYPIVRTEGDLNKLKEKDGFLWQSYNSYGGGEVQQHHYLCLFYVLNKSKQFVQLKNKYLAALLTNEQEIIKECENMYIENYSTVCYDQNDYHSIREKKLLLPQQLSVIKHNIQLIKKIQLKNGK